MSCEIHSRLLHDSFFSLILFYYSFILFICALTILCSMWDLCSPARDRTHAPLESWSLNHCTTMEVPYYTFSFHIWGLGSVGSLPSDMPCKEIQTVMWVDNLTEMRNTEARRWIQSSLLKGNQDNDVIMLHTCKTICKYNIAPFNQHSGHGKQRQIRKSGRGIHTLTRHLCFEQ